MRIRFDYDRAGLECSVPDANLIGVIDQPVPGEAGDEGHVAAEAMAAPLGVSPLRDLAKGKSSACVVIPDVTRPMPNRLALPLLLKEIEAAGVPRESILVLIATGLHRPNEGAELEEMVGPEIARGYRIENHAARDAAGHVDLGVTSTGVRALVDRRYVESDLKVLTGLVEPHLMAGYSGGRKLVCPGICAAETIVGFHSPDLIEHPKSVNCVLDGNPTHRTSTEVARLAGVDFTFNVVLSSERRILAAFAGELEQAFHAAADRARSLVTAPIPGPADIVITTGGGYPLDATWYQTIKGLLACLPAVKKGGTIIIAAGLSEGLGSDEFASMIRETDDLEDFMRRIREPGFSRIDQWQFEEFVLVARHAEILLYSHGQPREVQESLFVTLADSVEDALARALLKHGPDATVIAMPRGPYVIPTHAGG